MIVYLGLGSNIGNKEENLQLSSQLLQSQENINVLRESERITTKAWGIENQPDFLNSVLEIETSYSPIGLLIICLKIETIMGRKRSIKWGPRLIDIDILLYGDEIVSEENLEIPHKYLHERSFVLKSLNELIPEYEHPVLKKTISHLYKELQ